MSTTVSKIRNPTHQRRADHAWKAIEEILSKYPQQNRDGKQVFHDKAKDYGRLVKVPPTRILASGLGKAIAFRWAKGRDDDAAKLLRQQLGDWVLDKRQNPNKMEQQAGTNKMEKDGWKKMEKKMEDTDLALDI
jgi:CRISPR/Cas system CMR-associated protein Cmr5 small subunit